MPSQEKPCARSRSGSYPSLVMCFVARIRVPKRLGSFLHQFHWSMAGHCPLPPAGKVLQKSQKRLTKQHFREAAPVAQKGVIPFVIAVFLSPFRLSLWSKWTVLPFFGFNGNDKKNTNLVVGMISYGREIADISAGDEKLVAYRRGLHGEQFRHLETNILGEKSIGKKGRRGLF